MWVKIVAKSLIMRKIQEGTQHNCAGYPALMAAYEQDERELEKLKPNNYYKVTVKLSRNPEFHKLAFAFLKDVFEWQNVYEDRELMRKQLSIDAGHFNHYFVQGDKLCVVPKSWAFDEMDELEFQPLIAKIVEAAIERFDIPRDTAWLPDIFVEDFEP